MALIKRRQLEAFVASSDLPESPGHPVYSVLNRLLAANCFDPLVEKLRAPYWAETMGRPGVPPGVLFRILFVGYFEALTSHRATSWRNTDSRSVGEFYGLCPSDLVPYHSCVSQTHKRLPKEVFDEMYNRIPSVAAHNGLLWGEPIGIASTTSQANASMRSIVRKDSGEGWKDYTKKLAKRAGLEAPTDNEMRQFDRNRPGKTVSNHDCENPNDPDATITRMKGWLDTTTVVDTATDVALNAEQGGSERDVQAIECGLGLPVMKKRGVPTWDTFTTLGT